ncbi:MAG: hypothetical protein HY819_05985 [Acidobacteria bacterium]|nr:hypothetical protein [Acidobacteriota bacterium]
MKTTDKLIGILDSDEENQRLELIIENSETPKIALRLVTYAKGLGWNTQKTIYIDSDQVEELQFLLGGAKSLLKQKTCKDTQISIVPKGVDNTKFRPRNFPLSQRKSA